MTTTTFLGFYLNRRTSEEFVAPVKADDVAQARIQLGQAYPDSRYQLLTVYSRQEIEHVLSGIERWPGLPSKVQEPLRADLSKVTARTQGLPPLPGQVQAKVETIDAATDSQPMPAWMKSFVQQQQAKGKAVPAPVPSAMEQAMSASKTSLQQVSLIERLKAARGETMAAPKAESTLVQQAKAGSVIDILKGMRK